MAGCAQGGGNESSRFDPENRLNPTDVVQNATMSNAAVHLDPALLQRGVARERIVAAFGPPNAVDTDAGHEVEIYQFNADGTKFVAPQTHARNVVAGAATHGLASVVRRARIGLTEQQVTTYYLVYGADGRVNQVRQQ
jgi:hypothetical protein